MISFRGSFRGVSITQISLACRCPSCGHDDNVRLDSWIKDGPFECPDCQLDFVVDTADVNTNIIADFDQSLTNDQTLQWRGRPRFNYNR